MVKQFAFWLEGIIEDDPIPEEVDILLFNTKQNGNYKYLEMLGYEKETNSNSVAYYPLEAQMFWCHHLAKMNDEQFIYECKYIIEEAFESAFLKNQLKNIKVYFKFNNQIEYMFKV